MAAVLEGTAECLVRELAGEGQMLDPTMRNIEKFLEDSQQTVTGKVFVTLEPYRFTVTGIESAHDLMNSQFGSYGEMNRGWTWRRC